MALICDVKMKNNMRLLILILFLLLASCTVGLVTPQPTPAPSATPWPTNTPEPTPTQESDCSPHYWALLWAYTNVYANPGLTIRLMEDGAEVVLKPGRAVLLLESQDYAYRVVTADGNKVEGWVPFYVLPVECQ